VIVFNTSAWHYKLVMYVFGKNFFTEQDNVDLEQYEKDRTIVWTRKPKVVNFCPYCRGVLAAFWFIPFVYLWRKIPHKKRELTHKEIIKRMNRRSFIVRLVCGGINIGLGIHRILFFDGIFDLYVGILQIGAGVFIIFMKNIFEFSAPFLERMIKFIEKYWPKEKQTLEEEIPEKPKNPSLIKTYLATNHDKICPPVAFVDDNDSEIRR